MNTNKTVSVIMATYNGEKYLREQIDSILNQTYPIHELIIQDDCSKDSTPQIAQEYADRYPQVKFFRNPQNMGLNENFKTAAMHTTGDLVAISDQDDVWYADKIEKQVAAIGNHDICYSDLSRGKTIDNVYTKTYKGTFGSNLFFGIAGHTMLLQGDFIRKAQHWMKDFWYDWSLAIYAHTQNGIIRVAEPLNWHRDYAESVTNSQHAQYFGDEHGSHPTWQPYAEGLTNYRILQQKPRFRKFYETIYDMTKDSAFSMEHTMCEYLLSKRLTDLFKLCCICCSHRSDIYPSNNIKGWRGAIRGFFYPFIFSYHCTLFDD